MTPFSVQCLPAGAERRDRYRISGHNRLAGGQHQNGQPPPAAATQLQPKRTRMKVITKYFTN